MKPESVSWDEIDISGSRILVVDDNEQNVELLVALLEVAGYVPLRAYSGFECLEMLEKEEIDLILLDIMMPGMDGFEVLSRIRKNPKFARLPVIIVTALQDRENRLKGLEQGADEFLSKPVDRFELYARIKNLLRVKKLFDALEESYCALKLLEKKRETFIYFLVHDLKNPIAGILGHLQLVQLHLQKNGSLEKIARFTGQIEQSAKNLLRMVQNILDVARIEDGKFPLDPQKVDVVFLLKGVVQEFQNLAKTLNKSIELKAPEEFWLRLDPQVTRRVFENLLINCLNHTPRGKSVYILAEENPSKGCFQILFRDEGPGIPKEFHEKIFDPFERANLKEKGVQYSGHGLGLTFSKMATEAQGGKLYVTPETDLGTGATFVVELPIEVEKPLKELPKELAAEEKDDA